MADEQSREASSRRQFLGLIPVDASDEELEAFVAMIREAAAEHADAAAADDSDAPQADTPE